MKTTSKATVSIIGLGALGSHLLLAARNWDVNFDLIDFDRVESKNVLSQFHTKMGKGKNKATALHTAMRSLFGTATEPIPVEVRWDNTGAVLTDSQLVIDCTDNIKARRVLQGFCKEYDVPLLHGALSRDGSFARVVWTEDFVADKESGDGATCEDGEHVAFHIQAGAMIAPVAKRFLNTGKKTSYQLTPFSVIRLT